MTKITQVAKKKNYNSINKCQIDLKLLKEDWNESKWLKMVCFGTNNVKWIKNYKNLIKMTRIEEKNTKIWQINKMTRKYQKNGKCILRHEIIIKIGVAKK